MDYNLKYIKIIPYNIKILILKKQSANNLTCSILTKSAIK